MAYAVNTAIYEIGRLIVEHEQKGKSRAEFAEETVKMLACKLTEEFGKTQTLSGPIRQTEPLGVECFLML